MLTANAIVIYFAFGVPFGLLSIFLAPGKTAAIKAAGFAANLTLWPAVAIKSVLRFVHGTALADESGDTVARQKELRSRFQSVIPATVGAVERRQLLFKFDRLIALSRVATEVRQNVSPTPKPVHEVAGHPFPAVGRKCLDRKLQRQLARHKLDAFLSVVQMSEKFEVQIPNAICSELQNKVALDPTDLPSFDSTTETVRIAA